MSGRVKIPLMGLALALLAAAAYFNAVGAVFVLDDLTGIAINPTIRQLWPPTFVFPESMKSTTMAGRPLVNFTFAVGFAIGGGDPRVSHAGNILIHIMAGLVLLCLLRRAFASLYIHDGIRKQGDWLALTASAVWIVHPLTTQAVTYAVQRAESLMALMFLLALYLLARSGKAKRPNLWLAASAASCILGVGAKEVMAVAPVAALLYDRAFMAGSLREALRRRGWYYGCLTLTWVATGLLLASTGMHGGTVGGEVPMSRWDYLTVQGWAVLRYLRLALLPYGLTFDYGEMTWLAGSPWLYPAMAATAALLCGAFYLAWKKPAAGYPAVLFFLVLAPTSSFVPILDPVVEHRMYLPLACISALAVSAAWLGLARLGRRGALTGAALAGLTVIALAAATHARNEDYTSELRLWRDTFAKSPNNYRAAQGIAKSLGEAGDKVGELEWYRRAVALKPDKDVSRYNLGSSLLSAGDGAGAAAEFVEALKIDPDYYEARFNLGLALMMSGNPAGAADHFGRLFKLNGADPKIEFNLGKALAEAGRLEEGIGHLSESLRKGGYPPQGAETLADALAKAGRAGEALKWYRYSLDGAIRMKEWGAAASIKDKMARLGG